MHTFDHMHEMYACSQIVLIMEMYEETEFVAKFSISYHLKFGNMAEVWYMNYLLSNYLSSI